MNNRMKTASSSLLQSLVPGVHRDPDTIQEPRGDTWSAGRPGPQRVRTHDNCRIIRGLLLVSKLLQSETSHARMVVSRCTGVFTILLVLNLCSSPETNSQDSPTELKKPNLTG